MDIYVNTARPIVDKVLEGYNGTILAYGVSETFGCDLFWLSFRFVVLDHFEQIYIMTSKNVNT
jgi:hypothetical protein